MKNNKKFWYISYKKNENFLLYPNENIVRFTNKYINKRSNFFVKKKKITALDLGCGAGRHIVYLVENGFYTIGLDLSREAIKKAKRYLNLKKISKKNYKLINSSSTCIEIPKNSIDFVISHGTLDSMPSNQIYLTIKEIQKILKKNGLCYVDLISKKIKRKGKFVSKYDQIISEKHEKNTYQSFFDLKRIKNIFKSFKIVEIIKETQQKNKRIINERYCCVIKKINK